MTIKIEVKVLNKNFYSAHYLPQYQTMGSAALDLLCTEDMTVRAGDTNMISTGLAIWAGSSLKNEYGTCPYRITGMIVPRSGMGTKGIILSNTIGVIDSDYQGELLVNVWNRSNDDFTIKKGERFAQLMFIPVWHVHWDVVEKFTHSTARGTGGFGSTDK